MSGVMLALRKMAGELRSNPRLLYGLVLIALVLLVELGLRWSDSITQQQQSLAKLQAELSRLKSGMRNEAALTQSLAQINQMGKALDARLWTVSSDAVGQARLKDWLTEVVKRAIADQYAITVGASQEVGKPAELAGSDTVGNMTASDSALREFRATVSFRLTPRALEGVLLDVEGGEPFAAVETLTVKGQERRVEMTLRVLMRIKAAEHV